MNPQVALRAGQAVLTHVFRGQITPPVQCGVQDAVAAAPSWEALPTWARDLLEACERQVGLDPADAPDVPDHVVAAAEAAAGSTPAG